MDRLRQAVFSSLGASVAGATFVDLFAGSGAYGLEAWSRGARGGALVEKHRPAHAAIETNLAAVARSLRSDPVQCLLVRGDALSWVPADGRRFDLVFADPPYAMIRAEADRLFAQFDRLLACGEQALVVFEMPGDLLLDRPGWTCVNRLGGGGPSTASACFYRRSPV